MDLEKLIEAVRLCGSTPKVDQCKQCAYWAGGDMSRCIPNMTGDADAALSTLQAENAELRDKLNYVRMKRDAAVCCIFKVEGALDRGTDNKWAREHIAEWRRIEEG